MYATVVVQTLVQTNFTKTYGFFDYTVKMSSDSEDDCYGNIAQRLQTVKSTFKEDKIDSTNLLIELKEKEFTDYSWKKNDVAALDSECGTAGEISLDAIIANNSKKRSTRGAKRKAEVNTANIIPEKEITLDSDCGTSQNSEPAVVISLDAVTANNSKKRAIRAATRAGQVDAANILPEKKIRAKRGKKNAANDTASASQGPPALPQVLQVPEEPELSELPAVMPELSKLPDIVPQTTTRPSEPVIPSIFGHIVNNSTLDTSQANTPTRGRGRGRGKSRGRGRQSTPRGGRGRRAGRRSLWAMAQDVLSNVQDEWTNPLFNLAMALAASSAMSNGHNPSNGHSSSTSWDGPTYSVGNTDEYPDNSDTQPLFSSAPKPKPQNDVVIIENDQELEDNEELSIKVYWQSSEVVKFNLRPFQRLTPIFDHFADREKIPHDKLLFTYNDKILKSGDTPHSINYSIVKFIDGGVINQSVSSLIQENKDVEDGIKLKFQCMNVKKPFLASLRADEKMQVVMMKCAEHLEKPLNKLKFYFDGDLISDGDTPTALDLEGGECIDVNIIS